MFNYFYNVLYIVCTFQYYFIVYTIFVVFNYSKFTEIKYEHKKQSIPTCIVMFDNNQLKCSTIYDLHSIFSL